MTKKELIIKLERELKEVERDIKIHHDEINYGFFGLKLEYYYMTGEIERYQADRTRLYNKKEEIGNKLKELKGELKN